MKDLNWWERIAFVLLCALAIVLFALLGVASLWLKGYMIHKGWASAG